MVSARHPEEAMEKAKDLFVAEAPSAFGGWHVQVCAANPEPKTPMPAFKVTIDNGFHAYEYSLDLNGSNSVYDVSEALRKAFNIKHALAGKLVQDSRRTASTGNTDTLFRSGDDKQDAVTLLDCAYDIMEIWKAEGPYNQSLRHAWLSRAVELGAVPSP